MKRPPYLNKQNKYIVTLPIEGVEQKLELLRVSSFCGMLDKPALNEWIQRIALLGISLDPEYFTRKITEVRSHDLPKKEINSQLNDIFSKAFLTGGGNNASSYGTEVHAIVEEFITGRLSGAKFASLTPGMQSQLKGLRQEIVLLTGSKNPVELTERVIVNTKYNVAGRYDMCLRLADGTHVIADIKTGSVAPYAVKGFSPQLYLYASADYTYNPATEGYDPMPEDIICGEDGYGIIFHLPRGGDTCQALKVPYGYGVKAVNIYKQIIDLNADNSL